jgi:AcrR family transcriptional regulator
VRSKAKPTGQSFTERARREQIAAGAIEALAADGFHATSLAGIAARLGISKGVISYHYAGKAELMTEVVRSVLEQAAAELAPQVQGAPTHAEALRRYVGGNLAWLGANRPQAIALTEVLANARAVPGLPEYWEQAASEAVAALAALLASGQQAGEFGSFSAPAYAVALRAAIDAVTPRLRSEPDFDVTAYGAELTSLFEKGCAP